MGKDKTSKAYILSVFAIVLLLIIVSFCILLAAALLEDRGYTPNGWVCLSGFLFCDIVALVILLKNFGNILAYDIRETTLKHSVAPLSRLKNVSPEAVVKAFTEGGFKPSQGGFLRKKVFSLAKDFICYFVKTEDVQSVDTSMSGEIARLEFFGEHSANICLFVFSYKDEPTEEDFTALRQASIEAIVEGTVVHATDKSFHTAVPVLVDKSSSTGYYLDVRQTLRISVYAHGCSFLAKTFHASYKKEHGRMQSAHEKAQ